MLFKYRFYKGKLLKYFKNIQEMKQINLKEITEILVELKIENVNLKWLNKKNY